MPSLLVFLMSWLLSETSGCEPKSHVEQGFVVVASAMGVQCSSDGLSPEISYTVADSYPATRTLTEITTTLRNHGWEALLEDFLNPGVMSSHVEGWSSFVDATVEPHDEVRQWLGQWRNERHDVVVYALLYRWPAKAGRQRLDEVTVLMRYLPCSLVREGKAALDPPEASEWECPVDPG